MSGSAIMMMIIGIVVIWGGLVLSIANLFRKKKSEKKHLH
ncbi:methionine/alanine import family NSS transporter small subunit [Paenibacillus sp. 102]